MSPSTTRSLHTSRRALVLIAGAATVFAPVIGSAFASELHSHLVVAAKQSAAQNAERTHKTFETAAALRDLWVGHIFWVRAVSVAMINKNDAATKAAELQAVANAKSIAAAIEPFYGAAAKDSFFKLLAGHYAAIKSYLIAAVADDAKAQAAATQALTSNADGIATFLSGANPYLSKDAVHGLLLAHGGHHIQQIQQLKDHKYEAEAQTWEEMKKHVYQIADATADALAKQFAKKFAQK